MRQVIDLPPSEADGYRDHRDSQRPRPCGTEVAGNQAPEGWTAGVVRAVGHLRPLPAQRHAPGRTSVERAVEWLAEVLNAPV